MHSLSWLQIDVNVLAASTMYMPATMCSILINAIIATWSMFAVSYQTLNNNPVKAHVATQQAKANSTGLPPIMPQPIGPDPLLWQQTEDFPEGTRLTHDQADLLLSGRGFH